MSTLAVHNEISVAYLSPEDEHQIQAALERAGTLLAERAEAYQEALGWVHVLAEWRQPARSLLAAIAHTLSSQSASISQGELQALLGSPALQLAAAYGATFRALSSSVPAGLRRLMKAVHEDAELGLLVASLPVAQARQAKEWSHERAILLRDVYAPLFECLGLYAYKRKLSDISLQVLSPEQFSKTQARLATHSERNGLLHRKIELQIRGLLGEDGKKATVLPHNRTVSSVMQPRHRGVSPAGLRFDVTVPDVDSCYRLLQAIQRKWPPASGHVEYQDYISQCKPNGYRALVCRWKYVTVDVDSNKRKGHLVEARICTPEMADINEYGIIRARYGELARVQLPGAWWEQKTTVPKEGTIVVYSPKGRAFSLVRGATALDFAFELHSIIGQHCSRAIVNKHVEPFNYELQDGDFVEIEWDLNQRLTDPSLLSLVKTQRAQDAMRPLVDPADHLVQEGKDRLWGHLCREWSRYSLPNLPPEKRLEEFMAGEAARLKFSSVSLLYRAVADPAAGNGRVPSHRQLASKFIAAHLARYILDENSQSLSYANTRFFECNRRKPCCPKDFHGRISPGMGIVGAVQKNGKKTTLVVYREDCPCARAATKELRWKSALVPGEFTQVIIKADDRSNLLLRVLDGVRDANEVGLYLHEASAVADDQARATITLTVMSTKQEAYDILHAHLRKLQDDRIIERFDFQSVSPVAQVIFSRRYSPVDGPYSLGPIAAAHFKGRKSERQQIVRAIRRGQRLIAVFGLSCMGKTSLQKYLDQVQLPEEGFTPIAIDDQDIEAVGRGTLSERVWTVVKRKLLAKLPRSRNSGIREAASHGSPYVSLVRLLREVGRKSDTRVVVLIDQASELGKQSTQPQMHQWTRELLRFTDSHLPISFVLLLHPVHTKPWEPLLPRALQMRLDHLDEEAARRLIEDPGIVHLDRGIVDRIISLTGCHPYYIHVLLCPIVTKTRGKVTAELLDEVVMNAVTSRTYFDAFFDRLAEIPNGEKVLRVLAKETSAANRGLTAMQLQTLVALDGDLNLVLRQLEEALILAKVPNTNAYWIRVPLFASHLRLVPPPGSSM